MGPYTIGVDALISALGKLKLRSGAFLAVLLAFFFPRIPREEAFFLEGFSVSRIESNNRFCDRVSEGENLSCLPSAANGGVDIIFPQ